MPTSLHDDDDGLTATMLDAEGQPGRLRAPWSAIVSATALSGAVRGSWNWPHHASPGLLRMMRRDRPGHAAIALNQPFGPRQAGGIPTRRIEYQVERRDLH